MALNFLKIHKGINLRPQSSAPSSPGDGDIYYDSTLNKLRVYQNGAWVNLADTDGTILLENGTAGAPSLAFVNNTDMGFYRPSGSSISLAVSGADVFNWNGTENTSYKPLKITGAQELILNNSGNTFYTGIKAGANAANYTITLPAAAPSINTFLKYDGANYVWASQAASGGDINQGGNAFGATMVIGTNDAQSLDLETNGTSRVRIDSIGRVALANADINTNTLVSLRAASAAANPLSGVAQIGLGLRFFGNTSGTTSVNGLLSVVSTDASAYSVTDIIGAQIQTLQGAGSTITRNTNLYLNTSNIATNNAHIADNIAYTGNYFINSTSTNPSTVSGRFNVGTGENATYAMTVRGTSLLSGGSTSQIGIYVDASASSAATASMASIRSEFRTNGSFSMTHGSAFYAYNNKSASTTVSRFTNYHAETSASAASLEAVLADNASYTQNMGLSINRTAGNAIKGNLLIGDGTFYSTGIALRIYDTTQVTGTATAGIYNTMSHPTTATDSMWGIATQLQSSAGSYTTPVASALYVHPAVKGSGHTITRLMSMYFNGSPSAGTNNATIADNQSFSGNWFLHSTSSNKSLLSAPLGIGQVLPTEAAMLVVPSSMTHTMTAAGQYGILLDGALNSNATSNHYGIFSNINTSAASYTTAALYRFFAGNPTKGAGSTITRAVQYGGQVATQGTNNAFLADGIAFSGNWFIHNATALNSHFTISSLFEVVGGNSGSNLFDFFAQPAGGDMLLRTYNFDNSNTASHATLRAQVGGSSGGDPRVHWSIDGVGVNWVAGIDNSDSDTWKLDRATTLGGNTYFSISAAGAVTLGNSSDSAVFTISGNNSALTRSSASNTVRFDVVQTDNSNSTSHAMLFAGVGGASAGDPFVRYEISGVTNWVHGADNSDSDAWVLGPGTTPGGSNYVKVTTGGQVILGGNQAFYADGAGFSFGSTRSASGQNIRGLIENTSNTADSSADLLINVAGTSAGDARVNYQVVGATQYCHGIDNSDSDKWKLSVSSALGTNDHIIVDGNGVNGGVQIKGTATNDNAPTGFVGELTSANPGGAVTPAASGSAKTITSISLAPGDYDVSGTVFLNPSGMSGFGQIRIGISLTDNGEDGSFNNTGGIHVNSNPSAAGSWYLPTGTRRITLSATTTVYLVGTLTYSGLGSATFGTQSFIRARRVR